MKSKEIYIQNIVLYSLGKGLPSLISRNQLNRYTPKHKNIFTILIQHSTVHTPV